MKSNKQRKVEIQTLRKKRAAKTPDVAPGSQEPDRTVETVSCDPERIAPYNSYGSPRFVDRGYYVDETFTCRDCGKREVWKATQQKWWYEVAQGHVESRAIRCRQCRRREQERTAKARHVQQQGIARKQENISNRSG